jgi:pimeloyl-ACP methyl ester carboxylesterase
MSLLWKLALMGVSVAVVYQNAPGEQAWMTELPKPPVDDDNNTYESFQFVGGDGLSALSGRVFLPPKDNDSDGIFEVDDVATKQSPPPVIVMANGLGLSQDSSYVQTFVNVFTNSGFATITFDYATFGYSDGWPRHQVKPRHHVADLRALLKFLQKDDLSQKVDVSRIGLWGTSLGGGHVLAVAADADENGISIKAVVGNVPHVKSALECVVKTILRDPAPALTGLLKVTGALLKWIISQAITGETTYIPFHGLPGSSAIMQNPGDDEGYGNLITNEMRQSGWTNLASVGSLAPLLLYRPFNTVARINAPTLLVVAEEDTLCPADAAIDAVGVINVSRLLTLPGIGHFGVYEGDALKDTLFTTVEFFRQRV